MPVIHLSWSISREIISLVPCGERRLAIFSHRQQLPEAYHSCDWKPTFGKTLILDYFSIGPFYDFRVRRDGFEYIFGGTAEASLIADGLRGKPAPTAVLLFGNK
jgi:hypothetical protein